MEGQVSRGARDGAIEGIGGISFELTDGDHGDAEVSFDITEPDSFFYDPRSYRADFTDAMYMGEGKWLDQDTAVDFAIQAGAAQDKIDLVKSGSENIGTELTTNPDRENKWFNQTGSRNLVRLVDIWYKHKGDGAGRCSPARPSSWKAGRSMPASRTKRARASAST
jgi:hypothetical protein